MTGERLEHGPYTKEEMVRGQQALKVSRYTNKYLVYRRLNDEINRSIIKVVRYINGFSVSDELYISCCNALLRCLSTCAGTSSVSQTRLVHDRTPKNSIRTSLKLNLLRYLEITLIRDLLRNGARINYPLPHPLMSVLVTFYSRFN